MSTFRPILSAQQFKSNHPITSQIAHNIQKNHQTIQHILDNHDPRLIVIMGPCSFHDPLACTDYAHRLKQLATDVAEKFFLIMRVYLEKPRTFLSWKGYLNDPYCDETFNIEAGLEHAREFMLALSALDLPIASEILNPFLHTYFNDLLSYASIGARTSESQVHREIASGLSIPVGFKNTTSGDIQAALNGILFAAHPHVFLHASPSGHVSITETTGNPYGHLILRGGELCTNYKKEHIHAAEQLMHTLNMTQNIIVDCSHGNAKKDYRRQHPVFMDIIKQKNEGNQSIRGVMLESFLVEGNQPLTPPLHYGCSITDPCLGWTDTVNVITEAYDTLK